MNKITTINQHHTTSYGFSLIELLVVIGIIAVLLGFAVVNFVGARERAMDAKIKSEMRELKNALRLYYNDYQRYPASNASNKIVGCGVTGTTACDTSWCSGTGVFSAGSATCSNATVYMKKLPTSLGSSIYYRQYTNTDGFCLWTNGSLKNTSDPDVAVSQAKCGTPCLACTGAGIYCECED